MHLPHCQHISLPLSFAFLSYSLSQHKKEQKKINKRFTHHSLRHCALSRERLFSVSQRGSLVTRLVRERKLGFCESTSEDISNWTNRNETLERKRPKMEERERERKKLEGDRGFREGEIVSTLCNIARTPGEVWRTVLARTSMCQLWETWR